MHDDLTGDGPNGFETESSRGGPGRGAVRWTVRRRRSFSLWGYLLGALVGGIAGGLLVLTAGPALMPTLFENLPGYTGSGSGVPAPAPGNGLAVGDDGRGRDDSGTAVRETEVPPDQSPVVRVVNEVGPAVVGIVNKRYIRDITTGERFLQPAATGSGVIIGPEGYVVTNFHVVEGADALDVVMADGTVLEGSLVAHDDPYSDLAVLKVDGEDLVHADFGDSDRLQVGETVVAIGNPQGLDFFRSVTVGVVSGIRADLLQRLGTGSSAERIFELIQTDAAINRGNSGGPLVNLRGEVVGINTLKFTGSDVEGMGFAIPANDVRRITDDLITHGYVIRPAIGASMIPDDWARSRYEVDDGVIVADVLPGGPADQAGMREGDVILAVNQAETGTFLDLIKEINRFEVGDTVSLRVRRDDQVLTLDVVLGELTPPGR